MCRSWIQRRQQPAGKTDEKIRQADSKTADAPESFMDQKVLIGADRTAPGPDLSCCDPVSKPVGKIVIGYR